MTSNFIAAKSKPQQNFMKKKMLPPFFKMLSEYVEMGNIAFDCPGHQGGQYYRKHPAGRFLYDSLVKYFPF